MKKLYSLCTFLIFNLAFIISHAQPGPAKITSFSPTSGPVGTTVTIIGLNFNSTPANNYVFFGATKATVTTASTTTLTVTVPAGATYQYITVTNNVLPATAYSAQPFIVTFPCGGLIGATSFAAKVDFTAGTAPYSIAVGDLDGDGKADIAVANENSNTVSIFRNTSTVGTISFAAKVDLITGAGPLSVAIGDLNGDGKPDLVVADFTANTVSVFKNTCTVGTISFLAKSDFTTASHPYSVTIGDLDADGKPEIVAANSGAASVSILKNTGTLTFAAKVDFTVGTTPYSVAIGDLDGDGKPDIAAANNGDNTVSTLRHTGTGNTIVFAATVDFPTGVNPSSVAIGDLDADGKPDLVTANTNASPSTISVLKNTSTSGTISYGAKTDYPTSATIAAPVSVAIGDLDGDGKPDIACANYASASLTSIYKNTGTGFAAQVPFTSGAWPYAMAIADLDNDGRADLAVANQSAGSVSCLRNIINVIPTMSNSNTATICSGGMVNLPLSCNVPSTYIWKAANNANTTGESITNQTNDTIKDVITNNTVSVQTVTYTVTPTSLSGCAGTPQTITVTVNPLPVVSFSGFATHYCTNASAQTLTGSPGGGTFSGAGISANTFTPSVAGAGTHTVTYTYINGNGCTNTSSLSTQVAPLPLTPAICLVTVDSLSKHNILVWDKTSYVHGDTFLVYRDTANNNFAHIGKVPFDSLSMFTDTVHSLYTANGDPNVSSWRYKIAVKDTCGNVSAMSPYHQTIFNQNNSGNFNWSQYQIEGQPSPVPALSNYLFQRDNLSSGIYLTIQTLSASSTLFTDPAYAAYQTSATWRVITTWTISCTATVINPKDPAVNSIALNSSRSNVYKVNNPNSANENILNNSLSVSPNPTSGLFVVQSSGFSVQSFKIYNLVGECVSQQTLNIEQKTLNCDLRSQPDGIYFLHLKTSQGTAVKKIIKE
jgi:hypothetical protein